MIQSSLGISIIICCYNSAKRLPKTLFHLANQNIVQGIEVLIVDNNSSDDTAEIAKNLWQELNNPFPLRVAFEAVPGLTKAREKGIEVALYDYLIFCDDDNWLDENYAANTIQLFNADKEIVILGGQGEPVFESDKPFWFENFHQSYAVGKQEIKSGFVSLVYGAGLGIRKAILKDPKFYSVPFFLNDRVGARLSSGGDSEICLRAKLLGGKIFYSEKLTFKHFLTTNRLTWKYLKNLHAGFSYSFIPLHIYDLVLNEHKLPQFYWQKKSFLYLGRTIKYSFLQLRNIIENKEGDVKIIHIKSWMILGFEFLKYNTHIKKMYKDISTLKLDD
jgi:glycosyltransferase involved in cell wall biosynthesis